jgi:hypothetical protein
MRFGTWNVTSTRMHRAGSLRAVAEVSIVTRINGCAIAQAVSRRLSIAAAWVQLRSSHVVFMVDKAALGQAFSDYFGFP